MFVLVVEYHAYTVPMHIDQMPVEELRVQVIRLLLFPSWYIELDNHGAFE